MITLLVLLVLAILVVYKTQEDPRMTALKRRYYMFLNTLPESYKKLKTPSILTGTYIKNDIGSNVNKGGEIFMCLDGSTNDQFHILLHELSHSLVTEYDHTDNFWAQYKGMKNFAIQQGYYEPIKTKKYCGNVISDSS